MKLIAKHDYVVLNIVFCKGNFLQLQVFHIRGIRVKYWILEKDAMSQLRHLFIIQWPDLFLTQQVWLVTCLLLVHIKSPPEYLADKLQKVVLMKGFKLIII